MDETVENLMTESSSYTNILTHETVDVSGIEAKTEDKLNRNIEELLKARPHNIKENHWIEIVIKSGVAPEVAALNYLSMSDHKTIAKALNRSVGYLPYKFSDGFLCKSVEPSSGTFSFMCQFKQDNPRLDAKEKPIKYDTRSKSKNNLEKGEISQAMFSILPVELCHKIAATNNLEFHPSNVPNIIDYGFWKFIINNPQIPITFTEGSKKADALNSQGFPTISIPGVWNGRYENEHTKEIKLLPDISLFAVPGRVIYTAFDADIVDKPGVKAALEEFSFLLKLSGCTVKALRWDKADGKGIDDLIVNKGADVIEKLMENAVEYYITQNLKDKLESKVSGSPSKPPKMSIAVDGFLELYRDDVKFDEESLSWTKYQADKNKPDYGTFQLVADSVIEKLITAYLKDKNYYFTNSYYLGILRSLKTELAVERFYTYVPGKIPFQDGVLNLENMKLENHCRANRFTFCLPHKWADSNKGCKLILDWFDTFTNSRANEARLLLAWINCLLSNKNYHKYLILTGDGGAGKGTFIRLCTAIVGGENTAITNLQAMNNEKFEAYSYIGKRLITIEETSGYVASLSVLKNITGGDRIRIEGKNKGVTNAFIPALVTISSNKDIESADAGDSGIDRRRIALAFKDVITRTKNIELCENDGENKFKGEFIPYIPGLIRAALEMSDEEVENLVLYTNQHVSSVKANSIEVSKNSNSLHEWASEDTVLKTGNYAQIGILEESNGAIANNTEHLYPNYVKFARTHGYKEISLRKFTNELQTLVRSKLKVDLPKKRNSKGQTCLIGIALRKPTDTNPELLSLTPDTLPSSLHNDLQPESSLVEVTDTSEVETDVSYLYP